MKALNKSLLFATIAAALAVPMAAHATNGYFLPGYGAAATGMGGGGGCLRAGFDIGGG